MMPSRGRQAGIGMESFQIGPVSTGFIFIFPDSQPPPLDQLRRLGHVADLDERPAARNQIVVGVGDRRHRCFHSGVSGWPSSLGVEGMDQRCAQRASGRPCRARIPRNAASMPSFVTARACRGNVITVPLGSGSPTWFASQV
jgi:hypothetical protein